MNETLRIIEDRRSVRSYEPRPIGREDRDAIVHAAMRAPTAGNLMLYSVLEIEDQAIKDRLAVTCDHQPFIATAPLVLVFLADLQRQYDFFEWSGVGPMCADRGIPFRPPTEGDLVLAAGDALIAAQTAVIAAESLGIGSCYIGDILENCEIHRELLALPDHAFPIAMLCFGHPTERQSKLPRSSRLSEDLVVFKDSYRRLAAGELATMAAAESGTEASGPNAGQRVYLRKFASDFSLELNRSVREMMRIWTGA